MPNMTAAGIGAVSIAAMALAISLTPVPAAAAIQTLESSAEAVGAASPRRTMAEALRSIVLIGPADAGSGPASGTGSGFVFTGGGEVLTNAHVVGAARTVRATLFDGRSFDADVVGVDARTDIAVVRLPPEASAAPLALAGPGRDLPPGSPVYALGNPMGFGFSVTSGVISGVGRSYDVVTPVDFLQHDAALNPGSSGGPLVDADGVVVGVNTATPAETIFDIGIGLAIPSDFADDVARRLIADGSIERGALGLRVSYADSAVAAALGVEGVAGALVDEVEADSAAGRAGLLAGDLILTIDQEPVAFPRDVLARTMRRAPGERVTIDFVRSGRRRSAVVTLQRDAPARAAAGRISGGAHGEEDADLGLSLGPAPDGSGAVVVDVVFGSLAQTYGLGPGDRIEAVNGATVAGPEDVRVRLARATGAVVVLRVERQGLGVRHINLPRTLADSMSRRPGLAAEQQSSPL
ncbi:MAG: trypsin-like peptidase domain-containing protein [Alphaproteobacteria bacterium]|nr:trypsin-like peptidase domain-containing protein [Alphaproteobacteria bacterium]MBU2378949.1 trypsin-like peptidase domain-containing protein [Alphaproteobacteria bacterium]